MRVLIASLILILASASQAQPVRALPRPGVWDLHWGLSLGGSDFESHEAAKKIVNSRFDFAWRMRAHESFLLKVSPSLRLETGSVQSPDGSLRADNGFIFSEASANWTPFSRNLVQLGALNQAEMHHPILVGERPFPAARWTVALPFESFWARLRAESAVPTTLGLTTNQNEKEPTPSLNTVGLRVGSDNKRGFTSEFVLNYFQYSSLPASTAQESSLLGNTVDRYSDTESHFREAYRGLETSGALNIPLAGALDLQTHAAYVRNTAVASGLGDAWSAGGGVRFGSERKMRWSLGGEAFRLEPDATVATFLGMDYRATNRQGYALNMGLSWDRDRYRVTSRVEESDVIFVNNPQSRERYIRLTLETRHAGL